MSHRGSYYGSANTNHSSSHRSSPYTSEGQTRVKRYTRDSNPTEKFYNTGESSGKSKDSMKQYLNSWDARYADASRRN